MADGVRAGGASVRNDASWAAETQRIGERPSLGLCLVVQRAGGLMAMAARLLDRAAEIGFAEGHAPGGCAENQRQVVGRLPTTLTPGFVRRQEQHGPGPIQPRSLARRQARGRQPLRQRYLGGSSHPLSANVEE